LREKQISFGIGAKLDERKTYCETRGGCRFGKCANGGLIDDQYTRYG